MILKIIRSRVILPTLSKALDVNVKHRQAIANVHSVGAVCKKDIC